MSQLKDFETFFSIKALGMKLDINTQLFYVSDAQNWCYSNLDRFFYWVCSF